MNYNEVVKIIQEYEWLFSGSPTPGFAKMIENYDYDFVLKQIKEIANFLFWIQDENEYVTNYAPLLKELGELDKFIGRVLELKAPLDGVVFLDDLLSKEGQFV